MKKKIGIAFALAILGVGVALATPFPTAFRLGSGGQIVPRSSAPAHSSGTGQIWINSSDSNKLYYTSPSDSSSPLGTSTATLATSYSSTSSDNRVTVTSTGGPVLIEPSSSGQGALLQCKTSSGTTLFSAADNAAATLYGNAADSGSNVGTHVGTATALSSSRAYLSIDNGGTAQWKAYTTAGNVRVLECTAGTSTQVAGSGGLNLAGSISSDANIGIADGTSMSFVSGQTASNGAAYLLNTANTLGGSDLVLDVQNNNTDIFTLDGTGTITTPSVAIASIAATGTPSSSTYLRGDGSWASTAGGGATFATTYSATSSDNLVTEGSGGGELTLKYDGIGTAQTSGLTVKSTTAATSGNQKNSPMIEQCGAGYGTGGAASQAVCGGWQLTPTQANNASADVSLYQQNGGGSLTQSLKIGYGLTNSTFVSSSTVLGQSESAAGAIAFNADNSGSIGFWSGLATFRSDSYPICTISSHGFRPGLDNGYNAGDSSHMWSDIWAYFYATKKGADLDSTGSNVTLALTTSMHHVTNAGSVQNLTPPSLNGGSFVGCVDLIPDGAFTTVTGGNIAKASTAVVGKVLRECFDGTSFYPSY